MPALPTEVKPLEPGLLPPAQIEHPPEPDSSRPLSAWGEGVPDEGYLLQCCILKGFPVRKNGAIPAVDANASNNGFVES